MLILLRNDFSLFHDLYYVSSLLFFESEYFDDDTSEKLTLNKSAELSTSEDNENHKKKRQGNKTDIDVESDTQLINIGSEEVLRQPTLPLLSDNHVHQINQGYSNSKCIFNY